MKKEKKIGKDEWLTIEEVAARLRCGHKSVRRYILPNKRTGIVWVRQPFLKAKLLARADTVDQYIESLAKQTRREFQAAVPARL